MSPLTRKLINASQWLKSDMGTCYADLEISMGVRSLLDKILGTTPSMNGKFLNIHMKGWEDAEGSNQYDGKEIPW